MRSSPIHQIPKFFREKTLELSAFSMNYVEAGNGKAIVLLHGYTDTWYSFRLILPLLAARCRCFALDQRGHGASAYDGVDFTLDGLAGDVIEFLSKIGTGPVTLLGHSMGSFVARKVALRRPELVERLVLVASGMRTDNHQAIKGLQAEIDRHAEAMPRSFVDAQLNGVADRHRVPEWFFDSCVEAGARIPLKVWRGALRGLASDNHSDQLGEIVQPTLLIVGDKDPMFPPGEQEELTRALQRAHLELYANTSHYPHWEHADRFAGDVIRFVYS